MHAVGHVIAFPRYRDVIASEKPGDFLISVFPVQVSVVPPFRLLCGSAWLSVETKRAESAVRQCLAVGRNRESRVCCAAVPGCR